MRIAPDEVSFNDVGATSVIYAQTSQFEKSTYFYHAFEPQAANIFTMRDRRSHSQDKKLISHAMSRSNIILHESSIYDKAMFLMDRLAQRAQRSVKIPLYSAFRCMTLDTISDFAFGKPTGALQLENFESATFDAIEKSNDGIIYVSTSQQGKDKIELQSFLKLVSSKIYPSYIGLLGGRLNTELASSLLALLT